MTAFVVGGFAVMSLVALAVVGVLVWLVQRNQDHETRITQREEESAAVNTRLRGFDAARKVLTDGQTELAGGQAQLQRAVESLRAAEDYGRHVGKP